MAIAMVCFSVFLGAVTVSAGNFTEFITAVRLAFLVFTMLCAIGIFASYARGTIR
jgi:heme A synthase